MIRPIEENKSPNHPNLNIPSFLHRPPDLMSNHMPIPTGHHQHFPMRIRSLAKREINETSLSENNADDNYELQFEHAQQRRRGRRRYEKSG